MEPGNSICISPVFVNSESNLQNSKGESQYSNIDNSMWQTQPWYPNLLAMPFSQPFLLPMSPRVLKNQKGEDHPFVLNKSLALVTGKVTGKSWLSEAFQSGLPILSLTQREKVHQLITTRPGKNGVADVIGNKLIHFDDL